MLYNASGVQNKILDLIQVNKQYAKSIDSTVQQHLAFAQSIVSYTLMTYRALPLLRYATNLQAMPQQELAEVANYIKIIFYNIYKKPLGALLPYATDQSWQTRFIEGMTLENQNAILQGLKMTVSNFKSAEDFDQDEIVAIKSKVSQLFSSNLASSSQSSLRRAPASRSSIFDGEGAKLANGLIVKRQNGKLGFLPTTQNVKLSFMTMCPGSQTWLGSFSTQQGKIFDVSWDDETLKNIFESLFSSSFIDLI